VASQSRYCSELPHPRGLGAVCVVAARALLLPCRGLGGGPKVRPSNRFVKALSPAGLAQLHSNAKVHGQSIVGQQFLTSFSVPVLFGKAFCFFIAELMHFVCSCMGLDRSVTRLKRPKGWRRQPEHWYTIVLLVRARHSFPSLPFCCSPALSVQPSRSTPVSVCGQQDGVCLVWR